MIVGTRFSDMRHRRRSLKCRPGERTIVDGAISNLQLEALLAPGIDAARTYQHVCYAEESLEGFSVCSIDRLSS